jgi:multidrug transporter EmrE-like cation transporter
MTSYLYIAATILFTVYGQLIFKWQVSLVGALPESADEKLWFMLRLVLKPWVISGFVAALAASICWMMAVSKLDLSHAYPFMSLSFVLVLVLSALFFGEPLTGAKVLGMALIMAGLVVASRG